MPSPQKLKSGLLAGLSVAALLFSSGAYSQSPPATPPSDWGPVSINLEEIAYPYPVQFLHRNLYGQDVRIAYMDAAPVGPANGKTVVLLHGSSYYGWYWEQTMRALTQSGYRAIAVDRLGWGKSFLMMSACTLRISTPYSNISGLLKWP
jgi:hypothetical protein